MLHRTAQERGIPFGHLRLADPIYAAQFELYRIAGLPLRDCLQQDGALLGLLGRELRRINPVVLRDAAVAALARLEGGGVLQHGLVVCDDMRPQDVAFMRELKFRFVAVVAPNDTTVERCRRRGDLTLAMEMDSSGCDYSEVEADCVIVNRGLLEELEARVESAIWARIE